MEDIIALKIQAAVNDPHRQAPQSPRTMPPTTEARELYCHWAKGAARFFKGRKPVRFGGEHWKL